MATMKMSLKKMKELQKALGGSRRGYYITVYGQDIDSGKQVLIEERIARFERPTASADYFLVKGKTRKANK